jgi:phosphoenolpyruvate synthase/pyruvate phosphate dikinase
MAILKFTSKAETLSQVASHVTSRDLTPQQYNHAFIVPNLLYFSFQEWRDNRVHICGNIRESFTSMVAVRSSASGEDGHQRSMAGAYDSILNVSLNKTGALESAIEQVFGSYGDVPSNSDQVLIQSMVKDTQASGVIMTRPMDDGTPYYVLNYDDETGCTDSITSGVGNHKLVMVYRNCTDEVFVSRRIQKMVLLARSLEKMFHSDALDIEFALDRSGNMYLLQIRQVTTSSGWQTNVDGIVKTRLEKLEQKVKLLSTRKPNIYGKRTILGNMPDWNPAEIIGVHPSPLAASLYRHLITFQTWHLAREQMGYRQIPLTDLMVLLEGSPYIDVRASFNSFLPLGINPQTGEVLVNAWLDRLDNNPELHDKVEFGIATTVHDFQFDKFMEEHYGGLLDRNAYQTYKGQMLSLTASLISTAENSSFTSALQKINQLEKLQENNFNQVTNEVAKDKGAVTLAEEIKQLLKKATEWGTIPFSILARHGFIAESLLRSAVSAGAITAERVEVFRASTHSVMGALTQDAYAVAEGIQSKVNFDAKYGHLRPGTYDILSPTYRERDDLFTYSTPAPKATSITFTLLPDEEKSLNCLIKETGFHEFDASALFDYAKKAIEAREYAKFIFTRNLSTALDLIADWGNAQNLSKEMLAQLDIESILKQPTLSLKTFQQKIETRLKVSSHERLIKMGYLIRDHKDLYVVPSLKTAPNFISQKSITALSVFLDSTTGSSESLKGKIVCIENADPGFDWIFTKGIAGLVTKYGGANSHMAIRCSEFNLPAAIGCGELLFVQASKCGQLILNCREKYVRPASVNMERKSF